MRKILIFVFLLLFSFKGYSQGADNWIFGRNAGLHFNIDGSVNSFSGSALNTREGCSSYSDALGNLIMYSDGSNLWNRNHQLMPNGTNLGGNDSSSQSGLIVPNPNDSNIYYLFTVGAGGVNEGLSYNVIDLTLDNGLGDVVSGPINISDIYNSTGWSEKITAVKKTNGDYWVISFSDDTFYSFTITQSGLAGSPVISNNFHYSSDERGYLKVSPDGTKLAIAHMSGGTYLYDFDINTGIVSNEMVLDLLGKGGYGVEFSQNSSILYIACGGYVNTTEFLYQFDLTAQNINNSRYEVYTYFNSRAALQLGGNGKIYWASDASYNISVINNPNALGPLCDFSFQTVNLGSNLSGQGLPPFVQSLFLLSNILPETVDLCQNEVYLLEVDNTNFPQTTTYSWFLDDVLLPITTNYLTIDASIGLGSGVYRVEVNFNDGTPINSAETIVNYFETPSLVNTLELETCDDNFDGIGSFDVTNIETQLQELILDNIIFHYFDQNGNSLPSPLPNPFLSEPQTIQVVAQNSLYTNCEVTTSFDLKITQPIGFTISNTILCKNNLPSPLIVTIDNPLSGFDYFWFDSNGSSIGLNKPFLEVTEGGNYSVNILPINDSGCVELINFIVSEKEVVLNQPENLLLCDEGFDTAIFDLQVVKDNILVNPLDSIYFYTSQIDLDNNENEILNLSSFLNTSNPQTIYVKVVDEVTGCLEQTSFSIETENCLPPIPQGFSPNGDGVNDFFIINGLHNIYPDFEIIIYNRYGNIIYRQKNDDVEWDGKFNNKYVPSGTYFYILYFNDPQTNYTPYKGWFYVNK